MMNSLNLVPKLITFAILLHYLASQAIAQPSFSSFKCIDDDGNYTKTSTYQNNLQTLFSTITSNTNITYGFYNFSAGQNLDKAHSISLCRGDVSISDCHTCVTHATAKITQDCPNLRDAVGWYEDCMIWYSNENIFNGVTFTPRYNMTNTSVKAIDLKTFNRTVGPLLMELAHKAASGDSRRKFATGDVQVNGSLKMYALLQCTPNLQEYDCYDCLRIVVNYTLARCCYGNQGARAAAPSCNVRYENYRFYGSASALPPLPSEFSPDGPQSVAHIRGRSNRRFRILIISLVSALTIVILIVMGFYLKSKRKAPEKPDNGDEDNETTQTVQSWQMNFATVKAATNNFSDANKLGQGANGAVYKGTLSSGQAIAVKRLSKSSGQGGKKFKNEAVLMSKLQHRNLVRFFGFCLEKNERLLVYEYLPNKSLDNFLYDPINKRTYLDWRNRYKIIEGVARGLLYLHEESRLLVVHRDLKASNVLLDAEMNPKISDFGIARLFGADQSHGNTSKVVGANGYMPPEYVLHGQFSIKTDVFSFGVLVLEIVSGKKLSTFSEAENGETLLSFAWRNWVEGKALKLVDLELSTVDTVELLRCIHIGLLCVQENATRRPIMSSVVLTLNSYSVTLPVPSRPAFLANTE